MLKWTQISWKRRTRTHNDALLTLRRAEWGRPLSCWNWVTSRWGSKNAEPQRCNAVHWECQWEWRKAVMTRENATHNHYTPTSPSTRRRRIWVGLSLPFKRKRDSSVKRTSAHCLCNHRWCCWVHCSRFLDLITVKLLSLNGQLE